MYRNSQFFLLLLVLMSQSVFAACDIRKVKSIDFIVCSINQDSERPVMIWKDDEGKPFKSVRKAIANSGLEFSFLMNAGMYHDDLAPVGLYIENSEQLSLLSTLEGPGNFHMMPNGVFYFSETKPNVYEYKVTTTKAYQRDEPSPMYATQSGPMLVINNQLHPRFIKDSDSRFIRNGVGVDESGTPYFVMTKQPINFYDFALFFKDELKTPNALYFDGKISTIYAPPHPIISTWFSVGPMVGAITR